MISFTKEFKSIYDATNAQDAAKGSMAASRYDLASTLWEQGVNLQDAIHVAKLKQKIVTKFPKGTGKNAAEDEKKAVSNIRQVMSVYKKAKEKNEAPSSYPTYAAWREAIYGKKDSSPLVMLKAWIDDDKVKTVDVQALLDTYKAIPKK